jgi:hypothetical protein
MTDEKQKVKMFEDVLLMGGSITYQPAGSFTDEDGRKVDYDERIKVDVRSKIDRLAPATVKAIYEAVRDNKDLASFLGVKTGILS